MKRKISILTLALLFFTATTGMPITLHICKMMDMTTAEACELHKAKIVKHACCEDEESDYPVKFTSANLPCCQSEFVYNKIKDDFLSFKTETPNNPVLLNFVAETINYQDVSLNLNSSSFYSDTSPPLNSNPIYLSKSQLLI